jgi:hypothetical protein
LSQNFGEYYKGHRRHLPPFRACGQRDNRKLFHGWTIVAVPSPPKNELTPISSSFGCSSAADCRLVERILTVMQTLRLQRPCVLEFLHDAIAAHRLGLQGPTLIFGR